MLPLRRNRCLGVARAFLLGGVAVAVTLSSAGASVIQWAMEREGISPSFVESAPSARLLGFGNVGLAVRDEVNKMNTRDFGQNVAGILDDSDQWTVESWMGNAVLEGNSSSLSAERRFGSAGLEAIYRSENTALGGVVNWAYIESTEYPGDWARIRGPLMTGLVNQRVGAGLTLGLGLGLESENEDRHSADYYSIRHGQSRWIGQAGVQLDRWGGIYSLGWQFERGDIMGESVDPSRFHEDILTWKRPVDRLLLAAIFPVSPALEGGIRASYMDRSGGEEMEVSWSAESPENASQTIYLDDVVTFHEDETDARLLTRWRLLLGGQHTLALEAGYRKWKYDTIEGINFKGSIRAGQWDTDLLSLSAGGSYYFLGGRLLAALQAEGVTGDTESDGSKQTVLYGAITGGLEYFVLEHFVVRGGLTFASRDRDVDAPLTLSLGRSLSGGLSWLPLGGTVQVHGGVRLSRVEPWSDQADHLEVEDDTRYVLSLRMLL
jgi:hypothetical protein